MVTTCRPHEGEQGTYFAWPISAAVNPAYGVRVHGLSVGFVAVYDPETGRWRWIVPGEWSYSAPPSSRSANVNTVIVDVAGLPFGLSVEAGGVRVDPGPTRKASRFLSLTRYLPVLVVMEISPVGPAPQRGETASERGTTEPTGGIVPTPLIVPIVPVRRRWKRGGEPSPPRSVRQRSGSHHRPPRFRIDPPGGTRTIDASTCVLLLQNSRVDVGTFGMIGRLSRSYAPPPVP
ncbi:hypothetical protein [Methanopyrus kandleri]